MIGNLWEWADLWGQAGMPATGFWEGKVHRPWPNVYSGTGDDPTGGTTRDGTWNMNGESNGESGGWKLGLPFAAMRGGAWDDGPEAGAFAFDAGVVPSIPYRSHGARCARGLWTLRMSDCGFGGRRQAPGGRHDGRERRCEASF